MKIALVVNLKNAKAGEVSDTLISEFQKEGAEVLMLSEAKDISAKHNITYYETYEELFIACDIAVIAGGDGTIMHSARYAAIYSKSIIGVNLGRVGFVAELTPEDTQEFSRIARGDFKLQSRMVLDISVVDEHGGEKSYLAINDAVISRGALSRIIDLSVVVGDKNIGTYRADGLLFSTPTGSTAYALSAGGPIIDPKLNLIELTPVCPHTLADNRTVLFSDDTLLSVTCKSSDTSYLTVDGQVSVPLNSTDKVVVKRSKYNLSMITLKELNFYKIVGEKL